MATRSTIAIEYADGTVDQIYCHWDGYLDHNGEILRTHYMDPFKVQRLVELGDLSSLAPEIGDAHDFDDRAACEGVCTFYGRDRGETGVGAKRFKNFEEYVREHQREEYEYILRQVNGKAVWFVDTYGHDGEYMTIEDAMEFQAAREKEEV
jgi:hypothetical protein